MILFSWLYTAATIIISNSNLLNIILIVAVIAMQLYSMVRNIKNIVNGDLSVTVFRLVSTLVPDILFAISVCVLYLSHREYPLEEIQHSVITFGLVIVAIINTYSVYVVDKRFN